MSTPTFSPIPGMGKTTDVQQAPWVALENQLGYQPIGGGGGTPVPTSGQVWPRGA